MVVADLQNFDAQFMSQNARVLEERLATLEGMQIRSTDADTMDAHERLTRLGTRSFDLLYLKLARLL